MGNRIEEVTRAARENGELAEFLAAFVRDGELPQPRPGDSDAAVWSKRFSWWWDENPFCLPSSPRGFILRDGQGEIVGFNGMIPFEYTESGLVLPALVATTFFVRQTHRSAVMGMLARQRALSCDYHMIDGSPSPEMRRLLERLGYEHEGNRYQYYFPLPGLGGQFSQSMLRRVGMSLPLPSDAWVEGCYMATSLEEVESVPEMKDGKFRWHVTADSLRWIISVGSDPRSFFGLCDPHGRLLAYAIGFYKAKWGMCACMLHDYGEFDRSGRAFVALLRRLVEQPWDCGIRPGTDMLTWSTYGRTGSEEASGLRRDSILYYKIPQGRPPCEKASVPLEGDLFLL